MKRERACVCVCVCVRERGRGSFKRPFVRFLIWLFQLSGFDLGSSFFLRRLISNFWRKLPEKEPSSLHLGLGKSSEAAPVKFLSHFAEIKDLNNLHFWAFA